MEERLRCRSRHGVSKVRAILTENPLHHLAIYSFRSSNGVSNYQKQKKNVIRVNYQKLTIAVNIPPKSGLPVRYEQPSSVEGTRNINLSSTAVCMTARLRHQHPHRCRWSKMHYRALGWTGSKTTEGCRPPSQRTAQEATCAALMDRFSVAAQ